MVYLDYAATTPLDSEILDAMLPFMKGRFGNASSVHTFGRDARMAIERSRNQIAKALDVEQGEILFTGSASEANNLVVKGTLERVISSVTRDPHGIPRKARNDGAIPEIVVSSIEHPCIMEAVRHVEGLGWAKVVWLPVMQSGHVRIEDVKEAINDRTVLVSVMYVNNEIGSVQPIRAIGEIVRKERIKRSQNAERRTENENSDQRSAISDQRLYFHTDAVQAVQYFDCSPALLGVDLMTFAPHKAYGPKGVGVLYKNSKVSLTRQIDGGGQEYFLRAGTENVANIVGAGVAMEKAVCSYNEGAEVNRMYGLRESFCRALNNQNLNHNYQIVTNNQIKNNQSGYAPHILSVIVPDCDAEALIAALDLEGFAVSSGSACSSGVVKKSHVIEALGLRIDKYAPLRISIGRETTQQEVDQFDSVLPTIVERIRALQL